MKELCFFRLMSSEILQHQINISFKIFVYCRDNVVKFAGGESKEEFGVIHIAEWFAVFWDSKEVRRLHIM